MKVFVPTLMETGLASVDDAGKVTVECDHLKAYAPDLDRHKLKEFCCKRVQSNEVIELRWRTKSRNVDDGEFLYIAKAWIGLRKIRKLRLQCHKIRQNGSIGFREILFERHNGHVVR